MASRCFAYNPSQDPISGVALYGTLAVGTSPLDYSSRPGNITWWMGPEEDTYIIAGVVPSSNFPTPLGDIGTVQFWKTLLLNDDEFVALSQLIAGESFLDASAAKTWLESNNYWTNHPGSVSIQPVLYYDANETSSYPGSGNSVYNIGTGATMTGSLTGVTLADLGTGAGAKVFDFDGVSDKAAFGQYNFGNTFTVTAWVFPRTEYSINCLVSNCGANTATNGFKMSWNNWNTTNYTMNFEAGNGSLGNTTSTATNTVVVDNWNMLTFVFDKTAPSIKFYRNGAEVSTASGGSPVANIGVNNLNWWIGSIGGNSYYMDAYLGELKVFDSLLSASEIENEFDTTSPRYLTV